MASTYLTRTPASAGNRKIWTFSAWLKRANLGSTGYLLHQGTANGTDTTYLYFVNDKLSFNDYDGADQIWIRTNRLFRDVSAWYHLVVAVDTTQATSTDRIKIYVNGLQETSFDQTTYPSQNFDTEINSTDLLTIGRRADGSDYFDGQMTHVHLIDGTAYDASAFGEFDANGVWKIKTEPSVTYGTNGFFILKDSASVTDQSGNGNNFTVSSGTLTKTEDCPSNVFATFNPLYNSGGTVTYSAGNNRFAEADNQWKTTFSTLGASAGKYYAEFKCNGNYMMVGVADYNVTKSGIANRNFSSSTYISEQGYGIYNGNGNLYYRGSNTSYADTYGTGDIIGVALDCDNNKVFFSKNGTWQNSADPTTPSTGFAMTATNATYVFAIAVQQNECHANFGNGYFNTTAVSSAGTNASGIGIFEYDVPTGYTALSTKGLNL